MWPKENDFQIVQDKLILLLVDRVLPRPFDNTEKELQAPLNMSHIIWVIKYESYNMINISPKVTCGPKRRLPDGQMRTEEYKSSIWRRWSSRTFSTAAITLLNCRSLAEFISSNRLFSESSRLQKHHLEPRSLAVQIAIVHHRYKSGLRPESDFFHVKIFVWYQTSVWTESGQN